MPTEIKMPQLGESVHEGTIGKWLKRSGDAVAKYEPLVEVITDKVNVEMPSPLAGVLRQILVEEGATVVVGTPIALIEERAGATAEAASGSAAAPGAAPPAAAPRRDAGSGAGGAAMPAEEVTAGPAALPTACRRPGRERAAARRRPRPAARRAPAPVAGTQSMRLTPLVRRLAEENHLTPAELASIPGSGEGGRITKDDVLRYLGARGGGAQGTAPRAPVAPGPGAPAAPAPGTPGAPMPVSPAAGDQLHRLSALRRTIAERMAQSKREIPHAYGTIEVDLTAIVRHREAHKASWQAREGVNVSITAFLLRAATRALRAYPMVNATFTPEGVLYKGAINFGIGVAIPDGLIVPVIKHADQKSVTGLAREIDDLGVRAREGKLTLDDVSGGTFTLTNPGVFGSITSLPIINYPQVAILAADAIVRRPVVVGEGIAIREIMHLGLAFDHRAFDGATAVRFLNHIKAQLEGFTPTGDSPEF